MNSKKSDFNPIKIIILSLMLTSTLFQTAAQQTEMPEVGKPMPDFSLTEIRYFKTKTTTNKELLGKWLVLDFWFPGCAACVLSFPKCNSFHKEFSSELTWLMVGLSNARFKDVRGFYEKQKAKRNLEMPVAFDSLLAAKWQIKSMPHLIIVDPQGIVRHITTGFELTSEKIKSMINGEKVKLNRKDQKPPEFNADTYTSTELKTDQQSLLYRSILTHWNGERQYGGYDIDYYINQKIFRTESYNFAMVPLIALYNYAYIGRWDWDFKHTEFYGIFYPKPLLEVRDPSTFEFDYNLDRGKGTYNYSLSIPANEVTKDRIMTFMQQDLKRYFKYDVTLETKDMPVWKVIATPEAAANIRTKGGEKFHYSGSPANGFELKNYPVEYLIANICFFIGDHEPPFINATGISGNIDFAMEADMTSWEDIRKQLRKQGLEVVKGTHPMKVLVIRDAKDL